MKTLVGHTSPETAYVVEDYPFGFVLRCKMRVWVETKKGYGQRVVRQTTNPKKGNVWNKPHAGTYSPLTVMYLDEEEHVQCAGLSLYTEEKTVNAFLATYGEEWCSSMYEKNMLAIIRKLAAKAEEQRKAREVQSGQ